MTATQINRRRKRRILFLFVVIVFMALVCIIKFVMALLFIRKMMGNRVARLKHACGLKGKEVSERRRFFKEGGEEST